MVGSWMAQLESFGSSRQLPALWKTCLQHSPEEAGANHPHQCSLGLLAGLEPFREALLLWTEQEEWLRSATAGFQSPKTIGEPCCDRARGPPRLGNLHSGREQSTAPNLCAELQEVMVSERFVLLPQPSSWLSSEPGLQQKGLFKGLDVIPDAEGHTPQTCQHI